MGIFRLFLALISASLLAGCAVVPVGYRVSPGYYHHSAVPVVYQTPCMRPQGTQDLIDWATELDGGVETRKAQVSVENGMVKCRAEHTGKSSSAEKKVRVSKPTSSASQPRSTQ
jgi:hypothetical protein